MYKIDGMSGQEIKQPSAETIPQQRLVLPGVVQSAITFVPSEAVKSQFQAKIMGPIMMAGYDLDEEDDVKILFYGNGTRHYKKGEYEIVKSSRQRLELKLNDGRHFIFTLNSGEDCYSDLLDASAVHTGLVALSSFGTISPK
ncbi:MAG: hypothetical protein WCG42_04315 [Parachlamydiaceae bacterium]